MGAADEWAALARDVEGRGFDALFVADHPGVMPSPFVALAAAAVVTEELQLGTYVCNAGVRDPVSIASDAATVDVLSGGRLILGLGAGHTPAEWTMSGREYPSAGERVARLVESVEVVTRLLAGDTVSFRGAHIQTDGATLGAPRSGRRIPLLIGGNGPRVVRLAAERADIVGLTGSGRTLADGHRHAVDWSCGALDERVAIVAEARARTERPRVEALVQYLEITDDAVAVAERVARAIEGATAIDVLECPYVLIGTVDALVDEVLSHRDRYGITSYVVRQPSIAAATRIMEALGPHS